MDWKSIAIEKLKEHRAKKQALEGIPLEIAAIDSRIKSTRSVQTDRPIVMRSGNTYDDKILTCIARKEELCRVLDRARLAVQEVNGALQILTPEEQKVLEIIYMSSERGGQMERLCEEFNINKTSAYNRRDAALRKFTIAMYGCIES